MLQENSVTGQAAAVRLVIGIPTFRRPELLRILLESLLPELQANPAFVVVADNDCGEDAPRIVAEFAAKWPLMQCIPVSKRGVAQVRNAIVGHAHQSCPDWDWLLMLDDDGAVKPGWLGGLVQTGRQYQAHLVGGPVEGSLPASANLLARNSLFAARRRWKTGIVSTLNTTQNLAISRSTLALIGEPLFRNEYGASGGEDYDLFRRVAHAKGKIAWCDEAVVVEPAPQERLTVQSLLSRYATTGAYVVRIDGFYDGWGATVRATFTGLAACLWRGVVSTILWRRDDLARAVLATAYYCGRIAGLAGFKSMRYVSPTEKSPT